MQPHARKYSILAAGLMAAALIAGPPKLCAEAARLGAPAPDPSNWPQWRGPTRDGRTESASSWPDSLDEPALRRRWRVELGPSYSGPIVFGGRVFTTETRDGKEEFVRAFDRATGAELWSAGWPGAFEVPPFARRNGSWIRATPATDGDAVFVAGMRDVLACLDAATGAVRWRVDFPQLAGTEVPAFGCVSSPLLAGPFIYAQAGNAFYKLEKSAGAVVWKTLEGEGGMMEGGAFSSPILAEPGGRAQLIVQTRARLAGVDPESGAALWSQTVPSFRGMNILTPSVFENSIFTSSYKQQSFMYRLAEDAGGLSAQPAWKNKAAGYMSSPALIGGHIYLHLQNRRITCLDARTGDETWRSGETFGEYMSFVSNGDRILGLSETGELILIRANPEKFELVARRSVSESETWAHVAAPGPEVFVRELNALAVYDWSSPGGGAAN